MVRFNLQTNRKNPYSRLLDPMRLTLSRKRSFRRIFLLLLCLFPSSLPAQPFKLINITNSVARVIADQGKRTDSGSNTKREEICQSCVTCQELAPKLRRADALNRPGLDCGSGYCLH